MCDLFAILLLTFLIPEAKTPPSFPKKITSIQQTVGHSVRFECRVAGSSPVEISWLKDGKTLSGDSEFSMSFDDNSAVLTIASGEMRHSGEYTCVATNSVGTASCRAKLTLQGLQISFGSSFTFCSVCSKSKCL